MKIIGWREAFSFPGLGIDSIHAKIDTGAKTSCLHAFYVEKFDAEDGRAMVRFGVHPQQQSDKKAIHCEVPLFDERYVTDSGGHRTKRCVIKVALQAGDQRFDIEVTLTDRDQMKFRMLLGRSAMSGRFTVDPSKSYLLTN